MVTTLTDPYTVAGLLALAVAVFFVEEVTSFVLRRVARRAGVGPTVLRDMGTTLRLLAVVIVASNVVSIAGLSSLFTGLTVSAVAAVAISLALQTTLTNVISGLLLFNDGLVRLGDTIEYSGNKGKVVRVGLRNTWVKKETGQLVVVSNSSLSGGPLINHTATERLTKKYAFGED